MTFSISSVCEVFEGQSAVIAMLAVQKACEFPITMKFALKEEKLKSFRFFFIVNK